MKYLGFVLVISFLAWSCKPENTSQKDDMESAEKRIESLEKKVVKKVEGTEDFSESESIKIFKVGMNKKGFVWARGEGFKDGMTVSVNGIAAKVKVRDANTLTLSLPPAVLAESDISIMLSDPSEDAKSRVYEAFLDYDNRVLRLNK